jgi:hypothetical protein
MVKTQFAIEISCQCRNQGLDEPSFSRHHSPCVEFYSTKPVLICLLKGGQTPGMRKIEDLKTGRDETIATVLGKQEQSILTEIGKKLLAKC